MKFNKKSFQWEPSCPRRMDGRTEAFRSFTKAPKNESFTDIFPHRNQSGDSLYFAPFHCIAVLLQLLRKLWEPSEVSPAADR